FFRCTHESARAPSCCVARILALPQRVLSTHISLRALARRTRFRRSIPETPGFALGSNVRHSASLIASGRSMPPHPVSCSCCIGINSGFMLILHWTILTRPLPTPAARLKVHAAHPVPCTTLRRHVASRHGAGPFLFQSRQVGQPRL